MTQGCGKYEDAILDLSYGELDEAAAETFRTHAAKCPACAEAVQALSSVRRLSSHAIRLDPPPALDEAVLAAARESVAGASRAHTPVARPATEAKPGFFDLLRSFLLHPAFAGAAVISLVLVVTFFVSQKGESPSTAKSSVETVLAERPLEVVGTSPSGQSADEALSSSAEAAKETSPHAAPSIKKREETTKTDIAAHGKSRGIAPAPKPTRDESAATATGKITAQPTFAESKSESRSAARQPQSAASRRRSAPKTSSPALGGGYSAAKGAPARKYAEVDDLADPNGLSGFAPPPGEKKQTARLDKETSAAADEIAAPSPSAPNSAPSSPAEEADDAYTRGMAAFRRGDCSSAVRELSVVAASPTRYPGRAPSALHHMARCEKRRGRCANAVTRYEALIDRYPSYADRNDALYEAAQCYKRLGRFDRARTLLQRLRNEPGWESRAQEAIDGL